jgi:hypothetical protein
MTKRAVIVLGALLLSALLLVAAYSQEDMTAVDNAVFPKPQRSPAIFEHDDHNDAAGIEECQVCHHVYEDGVLLEDESSEDQLCSDCHDLEPSGRMPGLMKAFHLNCKGCHLEKKEGPVMCGECHRK